MIEVISTGRAATIQTGRAGKAVNVIVEVKKRRRTQAAEKLLAAKAQPARTAGDRSERGA